MVETADVLPDPDPKIVAAIGYALAELPSDQICAQLRKVVNRIYHAARYKGWPHAAASGHAQKFGNGVLEAIKASTLSTSGARLQ